MTPPTRNCLDFLGLSEHEQTAPTPVPTIRSISVCPNSVGAVGHEFGKPRAATLNQPILGRRSAPLLTVDGLTFKDFNARVGPIVPTVFLSTLEWPLNLTNVRTYATALLGDFGISDEPLLALITGKLSPDGHLPFELPSSAEAVRQQKSDQPHDSQSPLFPLGFGFALLSF
jgi:hypothetical protein